MEKWAIGGGGCESEKSNTYIKIARIFFLARREEKTILYSHFNQIYTIFGWFQLNNKLKTISLIYQKWSWIAVYFSSIYIIINTAENMNAYSRNHVICGVVAVRGGGNRSGYSPEPRRYRRGARGCLVWDQSDTCADKSWLPWAGWLNFFFSFFFLFFRIHSCDLKITFMNIGLSGSHTYIYALCIKRQKFNGRKILFSLSAKVLRPC